MSQTFAFLLGPRTNANIAGFFMIIICLDDGNGIWMHGYCLAHNLNFLHIAFCHERRDKIFLCYFKS